MTTQVVNVDHTGDSSVNSPSDFDTALTAPLADHLHDAHRALLRAYVACTEQQRDAIGALVSAVDGQLTELLDEVAR